MPSPSALLFLCTTVLACPLAAPSAMVSTSQGTNVATMAAAISLIAPSSVWCEETSAAHAQCRTAQEAAGPILASFSTYNLKTPQEKAAAVATMAYESLEFKYDVNQAHPDIGQGTRNMQSPDFNRKYAAYLKAQQAGTGGNGQAASAQVESMQATSILDWLNSNDEYSFGSAAWFLSQQCDEKTREQLRQSGDDAQGYVKYLDACVGIGPDAMKTQGEKRLKYYNEALRVFKQQNI